ncbi:universal stress protein [Nitrincola alkalilacustris]|uniref:universal stress protein n=1 Tax=Nitrincola alkalilacustris TaxID=1571224 RepID=UPI00124E6635|nr:universal stress protein [Nitrincola alkalilacustris]
MVKTFIVGFDGTETCQRAMDFAVECAKAQGGTIHLVHILEWSPYSFLTQEELHERHARKEKEVASAEKFIAPTCKALRDQGLEVTSEVRYGNPSELMCEIAKNKKAAQIFVGRKGSSKLTRLMVGSLGLSLVQTSPVPVTVVP